MRDYLYDGTFEGLLTCVYHNYYTDKAAGIYIGDEYQRDMLTGCMEVATEPDKAARVYDAIAEKISPYALRMVYKAYLSGILGKENIILNYILLGFKCGAAIGSMHGNSAVNELEAVVRKVSAEQERMLQFVRFRVVRCGGVQETDASALSVAELHSAGRRDILYAEIEPDHDVLELVIHHFAERFRHDPLIIHDVGRSKAAVAYEGKWYVTDARLILSGEEALIDTEEEEDYRRLWRTYFDHIAIKERKNPKCQRNFMPERYWKHLTEQRGRREI